jgi:hypothetical protein
MMCGSGWTPKKNWPPRRRAPRLSQLRFGLGNVFLARADDFQFHCFLINGYLRICYIHDCLGVIEVRLANIAARRTLPGIHEALILLASIGRVGDRRLKVRAGLSDLFRATPVVKSFHDRALSRVLCLHLGNLRLQPARIQQSKNLTLLHPVAFLHQHGGDSLIVIERQVHLPQVDIPMELKLV